MTARPRLLPFYSSILKIIERYFAGKALQDITALDIEKYLTYLRTEYKGRFGNVSRFYETAFERELYESR